MIELTGRTYSAALTDEDVDILMRLSFNCLAMDRADADLMLSLVPAPEQSREPTPREPERPE